MPRIGVPRPPDQSKTAGFCWWLLRQHREHCSKVCRANFTPAAGFGNQVARRFFRNDGSSFVSGSVPAPSMSLRYRLGKRTEQLRRDVSMIDVQRRDAVKMSSSAIAHVRVNLGLVPRSLLVGGSRKSNTPADRRERNGKPKRNAGFVNLDADGHRSRSWTSPRSYQVPIAAVINCATVVALELHCKW